VTDSASATRRPNHDSHQREPALGSVPLLPSDNVYGGSGLTGCPCMRRGQSGIPPTTTPRCTPIRHSYGIPFTTVGAGQALTTVTIDPNNGYPDESDFGINTSGPAAVPIPADAPIEGTDVSSDDRHVLTIDTSACMLYELYDGQLPA